MPAFASAPEAATHTTDFISDDLGNKADAVRLELGGDRILIAESWECFESVLQQPGHWSLRVGSGDVAGFLLNKYDIGTGFRLFIGDSLQATGVLDAQDAQQSGGGATEVTFRGRDALAPLHDSYVEAATSFKDVISYKDLVARALDHVGLDSSLLVASNDANRAIKAGIQVQADLPHRTVEQILGTQPVGDTTVTIGSVVHRELQAKVGETWHGFVRRHIDRAGLFLWASADGGFVLAQPDGGQPPTYRLIRRRGDPHGVANVVAMSFQNDATMRHAHAVIYGRGGGRKFGRTKAKGGFDDAEMVGRGYRQAITFRDVECQNEIEARFFARRRLAEERRNGWRLEYTVAGHSLPAAGGPADSRAVLTIDTVVDLQDDELDLHGNYYIESVRRTRSPQTQTVIRLMRSDDLIFGELGGED